LPSALLTIVLAVLALWNSNGKAVWVVVAFWVAGVVVVISSVRAELRLRRKRREQQR